VIRRALAAAVAAIVPVAAVAAPAPITGRWITSDRAAVVEVGPCGTAICGRIAKVLRADPSKPTKDVNNPDTAKRSRPILGMVFLTGFVASGDQWNGRIYDPRNGRTYRSIVTRDGATLRVKGCFGPFCRTQVWARAG
jgi:uncharacterized protein (DUF2147 family)